MARQIADRAVSACNGKRGCSRVTAGRSANGPMRQGRAGIMGVPLTIRASRVPARRSSGRDGRKTPLNNFRDFRVDRVSSVRLRTHDALTVANQRGPPRIGGQPFSSSPAPVSNCTRLSFARSVCDHANDRLQRRRPPCPVGDVKRLRSSLRHTRRSAAATCSTAQASTPAPAVRVVSPVAVLVAPDGHAQADGGVGPAIDVHEDGPVVRLHEHHARGGRASYSLSI